MTRLRFPLALALAATMFTAIPAPVAAQAPQQSVEALNFDTIAPNAIIMDYDSGEILWAKNPDQRIQPASMTKVMTVYMAFDAIRKKKLALKEKLLVSENVWKKYNNTGSTMFLSIGDQVTVEDLLHGIIVLSGNDACAVIAEGLAGSEELFVGLMNRKAQALGMKGTHFVNSNGLDDPNHYSTVSDLAKLAYATIKEFPDLYPFYGLTEFKYKDFTGNMNNRNPLLDKFPGADGLKTGGLPDQKLFGMIGSAKTADGRRLITVFMGAPSHGARAEEAVKLMTFATRTFQGYRLFEKGATVTEAPVWLGATDKVPVVAKDVIQVTMDPITREGMKVKYAYSGPIPAPVKKGQPVGTLTVEAPGKKPRSFELVAGADVEESSGFSRIGAALGYLFGR